MQEVFKMMTVFQGLSIGLGRMESPNVLCAAKTWATTYQGGDQETGVLAARTLTPVGQCGTVSFSGAPKRVLVDWTTKVLDSKDTIVKPPFLKLS